MPPDPKVFAGAAAIVEHNGNYLMIQRGGSELGSISGGYGEWCFPGGWIESLEQAQNTAVRECMEETSVLALPLKEDGFAVNHSPSGFTIVTLFIICKYINGNPINREPDKALEVKWVPQELMVELDLFCATDAWWRKPKE